MQDPQYLEYIIMYILNIKDYNYREYGRSKIYRLYRYSDN